MKIVTPGDWLDKSCEIQKKMFTGAYTPDEATSKIRELLREARGRKAVAQRHG